MAVIYLTLEKLIEVHHLTIDMSGGGDYGVLNVESLKSPLQHIQNDAYYPSFCDKLTHLIFSLNRLHAFADGNKRISITAGAQFLLDNGYLAITRRFLEEMENISYHLAAGRIDKELLHRLLSSMLVGETDFPESLKLELLKAFSSE